MYEVTCRIGSEIFPNSNLVHLTTASCCNGLLLVIPAKSSQIRSIIVHVSVKLESSSSTSSEKDKSQICCYCNIIFYKYKKQYYIVHSHRHMKY